jgi:hypothetical protein
MKVIKPAAVVAILIAVMSSSGCSSLRDMHDRAEAKRTQPTESFVRAHEFEPNLDPMGWNESNQNGQ